MHDLSDIFSAVGRYLNDRRRKRVNAAIDAAQARMKEMFPEGEVFQPEPYRQRTYFTEEERQRAELEREGDLERIRESLKRGARYRRAERWVIWCELWAFWRCAAVVAIQPWYWRAANPPNGFRLARKETVVANLEFRQSLLRLCEVLLYMGKVLWSLLAVTLVLLLFILAVIGGTLPMVIIPPK